MLPKQWAEAIKSVCCPPLGIDHSSDRATPRPARRRLWHLKMAGDSKCWAVSLRKLHRFSVVLTCLLGWGSADCLKFVLFSDQERAGGRSLRLIYWLYSFIFNGFLYAFVAYGIVEAFLQLNMQCKNEVFIAIWTVTFNLQMLFFPIVFICKHQQVLKINEQFCVLIGKHLHNGRVNISIVFTWAIYFVFLLFALCLAPFSEILGDKLNTMTNLFLFLCECFVNTLLGSTFLLLAILFEEVLGGMMDKSSTLLEESNFICVGSTQKNSSKCDILKLSHMEQIISETYQTTEEVMNLFGFVIFMWTLNSTPNYTLCFYFCITYIGKGTFLSLSTLQFVLLFVSQMIIGIKVFSIGDSFEAKVSFVS